MTLVAASADIRVLDQGDPDFPRSLLTVHSPPRRLYARGEVTLLAGELVAIVGSRTPSAYGLRVAYEAAQAAARAGLVVVSGMARGLDTRAHRGALDAGGKTIAVLGSGVDVPYPRGNADLYRDVLEHGLVLSEQEPGSSPHGGSFPARNRIIAALAKCLLVVEGRADGGTSNTAQWMLGLGKQILAVPGRIEDEMAESPNKLIRDGATIYLGPDDILAPFGRSLEGVQRAQRHAEAEEIADLFAAQPELLEAEAKVFDLLGAAPVQVDVLAERTRLDAATLLAVLSSLELKGLATQLPGKQFVLAP